MASPITIHWLADPEDKDYAAAQTFSVSAAYRVDEDSLVPGRLLWLG